MALGRYNLGLTRGNLVDVATYSTCVESLLSSSTWLVDAPYVALGTVRTELGIISAADTYFNE